MVTHDYIATARPPKAVAGLPRLDGTHRESPENGCINDGAFHETLTILVVEDERMVREVIVEILQMSGLSVLEAEDGSEALAIYKQSNYPIDLILTDVVMPQMVGRELVDRVSAIVPDIAVLYMSGHARGTDECQKILNDSDFFIEKPFSLEALVSEVRQILIIKGLMQVSRGAKAQSSPGTQRCACSPHPAENYQSKHTSLVSGVS